MPRRCTAKALTSAAPRPGAPRWPPARRLDRDRRDQRDVGGDLVAVVSPRRPVVLQLAGPGLGDRDGDADRRHRARAPAGAGGSRPGRRRRAGSPRPPLPRARPRRRAPSSSSAGRRAARGCARGTASRSRRRLGQVPLEVAVAAAGVVAPRDRDRCPVSAEKMVSRLLTPGLSAGSKRTSGPESVTAERIFFAWSRVVQQLDDAAGEDADFYILPSAPGGRDLRGRLEDEGSGSRKVLL